MNFKLTPGTLHVSNIKNEDRNRFTRIELAILREVGSIKHDAIIDGCTAFHFRIERTEAVRATLRDFQIEA